MVWIKFSYLPTGEYQIKVNISSILLMICLAFVQNWENNTK